MEALDAILTRRSIRRYTGEPVPAKVIEELLAAAMSAPSSKNQQSWQFVVITDRALLREVPSFHEYAKMVPDAPAAILVCGDLHRDEYGFWVQDCSAATQNILLAAHAKGLGAVWLGVYPIEGRVLGFRRLLGLPEHIVPLSLVPIGFPAVKKPREDRFDRSRIHENRWFQTIGEILPRHGAERGGKVALRFPPDGAMTYAELDADVRRFSAFLRDRGIPGGSRVAILLPNVPEFVVAYFGAIAAGCVAVPVNTRLAAPEVGYILSDCAASVVVTTRERFGTVSVLPEARRVACWVVVEDTGKNAAESVIPFRVALDREPDPAPRPCDPGDVAVLLYTSGTTGFPKGAMLSHRNTLFNVESCRATLGYREDDVGLVSLPLFHVTGLNSQLVALLACGATLVLQKEYDTKTTLELIARYRATALFFVPAIYKLFTLRDDIGAYDLSSVRVAAYGGAPMAPETIVAIRKIFPAQLHNCYGLTECSSLGTVLPSELALERSESAGFPSPGTRAEVRGEDGAALPPGEPGELYLSGPHIVQGYFGAPEKTRDAIRDGWLKTGDIARIDADGLVYILDRAKDMINRGGEKVYGLEVENVLYTCPGVAEAAVFGIPHPVFGEVPAACVVPLPGESVDPDRVVAHCRGRLADYKVPVSVRVVERIPRNPGGKILKKQLRKDWENRTEEEAR